MELKVASGIALEKMKGQERCSRKERRDNEQVKDITPREESCRRIWNPKEHSSDNDSLDHKRYNVGNLISRATLEGLEPSDHDCLRLHGDRDDIGTLPAGGCGVFRLCALQVSRGAIRFADKLTEVRVHVLLVDLQDIRLAAVLRKFIRGPGHTFLVSFAGSTGVRVSYSDEEVWSDLLIGRLVTHVDEVLTNQ